MSRKSSPHVRAAFVWLGDFVKPDGVEGPGHTLKGVVGLPAAVFDRDDLIGLADLQAGRVRATVVAHVSAVVDNLLQNLLTETKHASASFALIGVAILYSTRVL